MRVKIIKNFLQRISATFIIFLFLSEIKMSGCCFIRFESDSSETSKFTPTVVVTDRTFSKSDSPTSMMLVTGCHWQRYVGDFRSPKSQTAHRHRWFNILLPIVTNIEVADNPHYTYYWCLKDFENWEKNEIQNIFYMLDYYKYHTLHPFCTIWSWL